MKCLGYLSKVGFCTKNGKVRIGGHPSTIEKSFSQLATIYGLWGLCPG